MRSHCNIYHFPDTSTYSLTGTKVSSPLSLKNLRCRRLVVHDICVNALNLVLGFFLCLHNSLWMTVWWIVVLGRRIVCIFNVDYFSDANLRKLTQTCASLCKSVQVCASLCKSVQVYASLCNYFTRLSLKSNVFNLIPLSIKLYDVLT